MRDGGSRTEFGRTDGGLKNEGIILPGSSLFKNISNPIMNQTIINQKTESRRNEVKSRLSLPPLRGKRGMPKTLLDNTQITPLIDREGVSERNILPKYKSSDIIISNSNGET